MSTLQTPTTGHRHLSLALILSAALIAATAAIVAFTVTGGGEPGPH